MSIVAMKHIMDLDSHCGSARHCLANAVMSSTVNLVADAMHGNWFRVLDTAEQRRRMMEQLETMSSDAMPLASLHALRAAVHESDQAVARIVAHAVVGLQLQQAPFELYH